jgi:hypothetical protein
MWFSSQNGFLVPSLFNVSYRKNCSGHKLKEVTDSDTFSDNGKDDSDTKKRFHYHQDQRRMSLTSIVAVESPSSSNAPSRKTIDLGHGSDLIYIQRFLPFQQSWTFFDYLDKHIPWTRPTIRVFGRSCLQVSPLPLSLSFVFVYI